MEHDDPPAAPELPAVSGRVKWFDATRGFGFLVCDGLDGDVLLHFSVLRDHGRRWFDHRRRRRRSNGDSHPHGERQRHARRG